MARESIGGLWLNTDKNGKKYMSGAIKIDGVDRRVVIFKNDFKQPGEKSPDYKVYPQEERQQAPAPQAAQQGAIDDDVPW
jgi:uncharacterized protein (DUF736 family)